MSPARPSLPGRALCLAGALLLAALAPAAGQAPAGTSTGASTAPATLPVYLEESHAGAFYHLVETLPLAEPHTLILVDAHSDASAIPGSDAIRAAIRRGPTPGVRRQMLDQWRAQGRIQCFDWIEPLMPSPISHLIWVPAVHLEETRRQELEATARAQIDGHQEALPRAAGPLAPRLRVASLEALESEISQGRLTGPLVASIDLDFFAPLPEAGLPAAVDRVVSSLCALRQLRSLSFSISSPYLRDPAQAALLTHRALDNAWRIPNARVQFEPLAVTGPDRSLMARLLERQGRILPRLDFSQAGPALRTLLLHHWDPATSRHQPAVAQGWLTRWRQDAFLPRIAAPGLLRRPDGAWAWEAGDKARLHLQPAPTGARVRWYALKAPLASYRAGTAPLGYATTAPRWLWHAALPLAEGPELSAEALRPVLDAAHACGTARIYAEVERDGQTWRTPVETLCISLPGLDPVRRAWSAQFALPYIFDSRLLHRDHATGPETHLGADCANFIAHGLRAAGWPLPWGSPRDMLPHLQPVPADQAATTRPLLLHFGSHLAALWEDRPPLGLPGPGDLCVHQLEGCPEIISWEKLTAHRPPPRFMTPLRAESPVRILIGGDVMLGRQVAGLLARKQNPLAHLAPALRQAHLALANLECVIAAPPHLPREKINTLPPSPSAAAATSPRSPPRGRLSLVAPPAAVQALAEAGFDALSLANNHSLDLGPEARSETARLLQAARITPLGPGPQAQMLQAGPHKIALIAWDDTGEPGSAPLLAAVQHASEHAAFTIVLPHWGVEHQRQPSLRQRTLAHALHQAGADVIAGSGPHLLQPLRLAPGRVTAWSLGNLVFDGPGPSPAWSRGALLELTLHPTTARVLRARLLETQTSPEGETRLLQPDTP